MALKKPKNEVKFINKKTLEVDCLLSTCYKKFELKKVSHKLPLRDRELMFSDAEEDCPKFVEFEKQVHICKECGREMQTPQDVKESKKNYCLEEQKIDGYRVNY